MDKGDIHLTDEHEDEKTKIAILRHALEKSDDINIWPIFGVIFCSLLLAFLVMELIK